MSGHQGIFGVDQHFVIHAGGHEIRSMQDVARFCEDCCRSLGFTYFFFSFRVPLLEPKPSHFAFTNYPKAWLESYKQRGYIHFDPVFERVTHSLRPFPWSAVRRDHPVMKAMFEEMATLGLVDGLCIPLHGPNGAHAVLNMASSSPVTTAQPQLDRLMANSLLFVAKVFDRAIAVVAPLGREALPAELTARQAAVLRLIAEGKSYREIGDQLEIEPSTVKTLIERCLIRLGVRTREQAIVKAIATGQIHPVSRPAGFSVQRTELHAATVLIETRAGA